MENRKRIVFVNLHSDWMLLKTASVYIFKYSAAVKHGYLMKYLLQHPDCLLYTSDAADDTCCV